MFKKILVPIDISQSDSGEAGLVAAIDMADKTGADLVLLNVIADMPNLVANRLPTNYEDEMQQSAAKALDELSRKHKLKSGSYEIRTAHGQTYHEIISAAKNTNADLIVIASHRPELSDYLLGSTAGKVVRHAKCSVLVVRS